MSWMTIDNQLRPIPKTKSAKTVFVKYYAPPTHTHIFLPLQVSNNRCTSMSSKYCSSLRQFTSFMLVYKSRKKKPQKLTQLSSRSHPRHLVGKRTAQKRHHQNITSDSQLNSNFPYRWSPASRTFNNYFYLFLYLYIT